MEIHAGSIEMTIDLLEVVDETEKRSIFKGLTGKQRTQVRKNWKATPVEAWNATTVRSYLQCLTQHRFKMDYISDNIRQENAIISQFINQYGREILKEFIRDCVKDYKPSKKYPFVTFGFMYTYQRKHILPSIIKKRQAQEERLKEMEAQKDMDFVDNTNLF